MMNPSEMLRKLADIIDSMGMDNVQSNMQPQASLSPVTGLKQVDVDNTDQTDDKTMIPPLQQKIELLKKATGVENAFDKNGEEEEGEESNCGCGGESDEIDVLKKNAGLPTTAVVQVASEDNDITG
jgi:hypothetical protein